MTQSPREPRVTPWANTQKQRDDLEKTYQVNAHVLRLLWMKNIAHKYKNRSYPAMVTASYDVEKRPPERTENHRSTQMVDLQGVDCNVRKDRGL